MAELLPTEVALPTQPIDVGSEQDGAVPVINCGAEMQMIGRPGDASPNPGGSTASPAVALGTGQTSTALDAEHIARKLKNHESITSSQIRNVEATFEQLLHQATSSLRKDIASREERLTRRMDSERKEQQTALLELRRDLTMQQTSDLATYEDRLSRRLDSERREQKTALAELRREIGAQQEHRVQIASLRRDLGTTQAALTKLAQSRGNMSMEASLASSDGQLQSTTASEQSSSALSEAAVAEMRREITDLRDQLQLQATSAEAALGNLRKELESIQSEDMRSTQEQLSRGTAEFSRNLQDVMGVVEASGNALRAEMRRELDRFRLDLDKPADGRVARRSEPCFGASSEGSSHRMDGTVSVPPLQIACGTAGGSVTVSATPTKGSKSPTGGSATGSANSGGGGVSITASAAAGAPSEGADIVALRSAVQGLEARLDGASQNIITLGRDLSEHQQRIDVMVHGTQRDVGRLAEELAAQMTRSAAVQDNANADIKCLATELAQQRLRADDVEKTIANLVSQAAQAVEAAASLPQSAATVPKSAKGMDEDQVREMKASVVKDVEAASKKVLEELLNHMMTLEAAMQRAVGTMDSTIDEVRSKVSQVGEDVARERDERCSALAGISCRAEDAADMAKKLTEELSALSKRVERGSPKQSEVTSTEMDSVSERADRFGGRPTPPESTGPTGLAGFPNLQPGSLEHNALAACLGEMDAELRLELSQKLKTVKIEVFREIDKRISGLEKQVGEGTFGDPVLKKMQNRIQALEDSRLDLRLGALESAAHHGAVFSVAAVQAAAAEQALAKAAQAEKELNDLDVSRRAILSPTAAASSQEKENSAENWQEAEQRIQERIEARLDGKLDALTRSRRSSGPTPGENVVPTPPKRDVEHVEHVELLEDVRNAHEALSSLAALRDGIHSGNSISEDQGGNAEGWQLSDQLKERLDVLVQQVKATLRDNPPESPGASSQCSRAMSAVIPTLASSRLMANLGLNSGDSARTPYAGVPTQVVTRAPHSNPSLSAPVLGNVGHESIPTIGTLVDGLATGGSTQFGAGFGSSVSATPAQPPPMVVSHTAATTALGSRAVPTLGALQTTVTAPPEQVHITAAPVVPVPPTNVTQSGPPVLKSIFVSEAQRRPHSPLRNISPLRRRESVSPVRGPSPVRQRDTSPVRFTSHGGASPLARTRDISPSRLAQMPPLQVASTAALGTAAPVLASPGVGQMTTVGGQETPRAMNTAAFASSWFNVRR